jgi:predicted AlkP superfamily pyrophosphatase or phosphodiesterase
MSTARRRSSNLPFRLGSILILLLRVGFSDRLAEGAERNVVVVSLDGFPSALLDDPQASLPVLRALVASGAVSIPGMKAADPTVTWPNHTTLMTGLHPDRHGVLFNGLLERRGSGMPVALNSAKTQSELVRVPLLFDLLKESGISSSAINWPCTRGSSSLVDNFPDVPDQLDHTSPELKRELLDRGLLQRFEEGNALVRDEIWTEAACEVIRRRMPRLLTVHLLNLDSTHHEHGPLSRPGYTAAAVLDANLGRILRALDEAGVRKNTVVMVVSDHGFAPVTKAIRPNAILRRAGFITLNEEKIGTARAMAVPEGGTAMVYLTDPAKADEDASAVRRLFEGAEGIAAVIGPEDFPKYHLPSPSENPGMADLILAANDGYSFSGIPLGDRLIAPSRQTTGSHGYLTTNPRMTALFVAAGPGVRKGTRLPAIENTDVAPTVGKLLGFTLKDVAGRVLNEMLDADD